MTVSECTSNQVKVFYALVGWVVGYVRYTISHAFVYKYNFICFFEKFVATFKTFRVFFKLRKRWWRLGMRTVVYLILHPSFVSTFYLLILSMGSGGT